MHSPRLLYRRFVRKPLKKRHLKEFTFTSKDRLTETRLYKQPATDIRYRVLITLASLNTNTEYAMRE